MKILIDHGASYNLGDIAMLEAVVLRLRRLSSGVNLFIIDNPAGLRTHLWRLPDVHRYSLKLKPKLSGLFENARFFWRYDAFWRRIVYNIALSFRGAFAAKSSCCCGSDEIKQRGLDELCVDFDGLLITGGGNLNDSFPESLFSKCCLINAFIEQFKPVMLTGQQIGPLKRYLPAKCLSKVLSMVNFIGLREPGESLNFVRRVGIDSNRFEIMGDDSLGLEPAEEPVVLELLNKYNLKPMEFLAVNIRVSSYAKEFKRQLFKIGLLFEKLAEKLNMSLLVVPIAFNPGDSDCLSGQKLITAIRCPNIKILEYPVPSPSITKGVLGKAFGVVGVSYHFCTFALSRGVSAVCLYDGKYYSQKAKGLQLFWKDYRFAHPLKDIDIDSAVEQISETLNDADLRTKLVLRAKEASLQWQDIFDRKIKEAFGNCELRSLKA